MASILPFEQETGNGPRRPSPEAVVGKLERAGSQYLQPLLAEMLDQADDALFEMADKAENNRQQTLYFDAMREVRRVRAEMERAFARALEEGFRTFLRDQASGPGASPLHEEELQLIDQEAMEESVALGNIANKVRNRYGEEVEAVHQRLEHLSRAEVLTPERDPLSPTALVNAFGQAAGALDAELEVRLVLFKLFDRHVAGNLLPLYQAANRILIDAGVLPRLPREWVRPAGGAAGTAPPAGEAAPNPAPPAGTGADPESELLATLHQILGQGGPHLGAAGGPAAAGTTAVPGAVLGGLTGLQQQPPPQGGGVAVISPAQVREQLAEAGRMAPMDDALIDVVAMLFEMLLAEEGLPDAAKAQIGRLQIPVLKVGLLDKGFFGRRSHPARRLLDGLIQVGMGADETGPEGTAELALISGTVERVLAEFETEVGLFTELADEVEAFLAGVAEREEEAREAARREAAEREAREQARAEAVAAAEALLAEGVPEPVSRLLGGPWLEVLARARLARDDGAWEAAVAFGERLVWSVRPKPTAEERRKLAVAIPELLGTLRQELAAVGVAGERLDELVGALEPLHLARLDPEQEEVPGAAREAAEEMADAIESQVAALDELEAIFSAPLLEDAETEEAAVPVLGPDEVVVLGGRRRQEGPEDEYLEAARALQVGDWLRLTADDGRTTRLKVAWKSDLLEEVLLTNWRRHKEERTLHGLAAELRCGVAEVLPGAPAFERTLERLLGRLKGAPQPA